MRARWLLVLLPALGWLWVADPSERGPGVLAAPLALLGLVALARARRWALAFELENARALVLTAVGAPVGTLLATRAVPQLLLGVRGGTVADEALLALLGLGAFGLTLQVVPLASEPSQRTLAAWLTQPHPVGVLVARRWALGAGAWALGLAGLLGAVPWSALAAAPLLVWAFVIAAGVGGWGPFFALLLKDFIYAPFAAFAVTVVPLLALERLCGGQPPEAPLGLAAGVLAYLGAAGVSLGWAVLRGRGLVLWAPRAGSHRRFSPGRGSAARALLYKELGLLWPAAQLSTSQALVWAFTSGEQRVWLTLFTGLVCTALATMCVVLNERQYETLATQLSLLPVRQVWALKVGLVGAIAAVAGVLLPGVVLALSGDLAEVLAPSPVHAVLSWLLVVALTAGAGLASSAHTMDLKTSGLVMVGALLWLMLCVTVPERAGGWLVHRLVSLPTTGWYQLSGTLKLVELLPGLVALALLWRGAWAGFRGEPLPRRVLLVLFGPVAAVSLVVGVVETAAGLP